jgi:hypothetical protein
MNHETLSKRVELMEETYELQLKQNDALLQRMETLSKSYNAKLREHTELLKEQYKETLKDYIKQQTQKYKALDVVCTELKQELVRNREQHKVAVDKVVNRMQVEMNEKHEETLMECERLREEDKQHLVKLKENNMKQACTITLQKQQLADQAIEHSTRLVQMKKYEATVTDQSNRIHDLQRKLNDQKEYTGILENKLVVLTDRLKTLNVPEDFVEKEKQMMGEINTLTRKAELLERTVDNWKTKYQLLENSSKRKKKG